jgi:dethiobiotin synthetase
MQTGYFIAGTDTGVGKTRVGTAVVHGLAARGLDVRVRKPVESGCLDGPGGLLPQDAAALREAAGAREPLEEVCRYRLRAAVSPERAAALEGVALDLGRLRAACAGSEGGDVLIVEGAGGLCSPIAAGALNADLASALGFPVLLVAADRLGTINHVLLSVEAIARRGLALAGIVLSAPDASSPPGMDNAGDIARWTGHRVHLLPHGDAGGAASRAEDARRLAALLDSLAPPRPARP